MDFSFTPEQERFRQEIREFLRQEITPEFRRQLEEEAGEEWQLRGHSLEFSRKLGQKGWIGLAWPKEYGGQGLGYIERLIYDEEMSLGEAPTAYHHAAERQFGPSIILHGTEEQKREFLPRIARGEMHIAIGYSEDNAGSDLAALECSAVEDGDYLVVNGHKLWQTVYPTEWMWTAVRTDFEARKHRGISILMIEMSLPGVTIRPTPLMDGLRKKRVTFDNVRVPKEYMIGEENRGWYVLAANLDFERAGVEMVISAWRLFQELVEVVKKTSRSGRPLADDPMVRHQLAQLATEIQVGRMLCYRTAYMLSKEVIPNLESAMAKCFNSELVQRVARVGLDILGLHGTLDEGEGYGVLEGELRRRWLSTISDTFAAGPGEIMRNVIAIRGLDLPREPRRES